MLTVCRGSGGKSSMILYVYSFTTFKDGSAICSVTMQSQQRWLWSTKKVMKPLWLRFDAVSNNMFLSGLNACALAQRETHEQNKWVALFEEELVQMEKLSTVMTAPRNCQHKLDLMKAEKASFLGKHTEAASFYDSAINLADQNHFIQDQALALERAGIFYLGRDDGIDASMLFERSHSCYMQWGALSKAGDIKERYLNS
mmetsp:Transcript_23680/g.70039  ORF Transcript_23680/g.70039 Transcript_23680/m.70039 type:complete len:200 (-) Transcript_23680:86-685(-)